MNKIRSIIISLLIASILFTGGYSAVKIGDAMTLRKELTTLSYILRITEHLHTAIEGLQKERAIATQAAPDRNQLFLVQVKNTDQHFDLFQKELHKTQIRLLAMPDSEITQLRKMLSGYRQKILAADASQPYYVEVVHVFIIQLKRLYEFGRIETLKDYESSIMHATELKESIQQDLTDVTSKLREKISPAEMTQLKQNLERRISKLQELNMPDSQYWIKIGNEILSTPHEFNGSGELGARYQSASEIFWVELRKHEKKLVVTLQETISNRLIELRESIIKTIIVGFSALIGLAGLIFALRKWKPRSI